MNSLASLFKKQPTSFKFRSLWAVLLLCAVGLFVSGNATSQTAVEQLHEAIAKGNLTTEAIVGTGGSSGLVIKGYLVNQNSVDLNINIQLEFPIFFANRGKGQNMVATQVYRRGGAYLSNGTHGFVQVPGNSRTPVDFIAYCVDFDKPNPTSDDLFDITDMPADIRSVVRSISEAERTNPNRNLTLAAQLALWVSQGESLEAIRKKV